jgi:hypothetical protein
MRFSSDALPLPLLRLSKEPDQGGRRDHECILTKDPLSATRLLHAQHVVAETVLDFVAWMMPKLLEIDEFARALGNNDFVDDSELHRLIVD